MADVEQHFDVLVIGGGIAGMQSALDVAEQGFRVAMVEVGPSIGGKMIQLSKVFPTLDCASCITTPKMAQVAHHDSIKIFTLAEVTEVSGEAGDFTVRVVQKPRYVDEVKCIGCGKCELACPVMVPSAEQGGFSARKAIYIPFSSATPLVPLLDVDMCIACGRCAKVCPTAAVDYYQEPVEIDFKVKALVAATGYSFYHDFPRRAWGEESIQPNVIDALQMERLLAPTSPYQRLLRPSDGKIPESVAFVQCAGSRDVNYGKPHCSRVCCMYNIKQAILIARERPETTCTIFYMDVRCYGKGYEQFFTTAKEMGIEFVKAKAMVAGKGPDDGVRIRYEDLSGLTGPQEKRYDLAVLSLAIIPAWNPDETMNIELAEDEFIASPQVQLSSSLTSREGIFMAGTAAGPKDIVDTIIEAGAAASEAGIFLRGVDADQRTGRAA
jgi:heterodisulfide reductase subunit A2